VAIRKGEVSAGVFNACGWSWPAWVVAIMCCIAGCSLQPCMLSGEPGDCAPTTLFGHKADHLQRVYSINDDCSRAEEGRGEGGQGVLGSATDGANQRVVPNDASSQSCTSKRVRVWTNFCERKCWRGNGGAVRLALRRASMLRNDAGKTLLEPPLPRSPVHASAFFDGWRSSKRAREKHLEKKRGQVNNISARRMR
jgi:hypothetical protein